VSFVLFVDTSSLPPFAAVLLAGGKSSRMGRDKASVVIDGQPLWQRQLATLRATGAQELFISGKPDGPYADSGIEIIVDSSLGRGPLAGLEAALRRTRQPLLLVLAIDLPDMTSTFLADLVRRASTNGLGVVPRTAEWFEPLAAVYSPACLPLVEECLRGEDHSMQRFVREAVAQNLVEERPLTLTEHVLFRNLNAPADL
jgi:molybdopterin-guanine dinucleotide biosynthesis protein A